MNVYTGGTFDLFHPGHLELLKKCKQLAGEGEVIVALNTDEFIQQFKGRAPIMNFEERKQMLLNCRYVSKVIKNVGGADSTKNFDVFIKTLKDVKLVVIGSDWHEKDYLKQMNFTWEWLDSMGLSLCYVPRVTKNSTTDIKQRIKNV